MPWLKVLRLDWKAGIVEESRVGMVYLREMLSGHQLWIIQQFGKRITNAAGYSQLLSAMENLLPWMGQAPLGSQIVVMLKGGFDVPGPSLT